jgi:hypothetical protein
MDGLLGVLVSSIIAKLLMLSIKYRKSLNRTHPNIISLIHKLERQASLLICQAYPHLTVHEQAMVHVDNVLPYTLLPIIDFLVLFSLSPSQTMQA